MTVSQCSWSLLYRDNELCSPLPILIARGPNLSLSTPIWGSLDALLLHAITRCLVSRSLFAICSTYCISRAGQTSQDLLREREANQHDFHKRMAFEYPRRLCNSWWWITWWKDAHGNQNKGNVQDIEGTRCMHAEPWNIVIMMRIVGYRIQGSMALRMRTLTDGTATEIVCFNLEIE